MKIFSNFDTGFRKKVLKKIYSKFPEEEVLVIRRSKYHLIFRVILPFLILAIMAYGFYRILMEPDFYGELSEYMSVIFIAFAIVWGIMIWFICGHRLLKFLYDFTIVDPTGITTYKQKGILHSNLKQIPSQRIRSLQIHRSSILENIFAYGKIEIHTDFTENMHIGEDNESPSVIALTYVDKPYKKKNKITDICFK